MKITLLGMPGSGKTTLARQISSIINIPFFDTDKLIEEKFKLTIDQIFLKYGEKKFREFEHQILEVILKKEKFILSVGGGLPCFYNHMELINRLSVSVYLNINKQILIQRLLKDKAYQKRPLLKGLSDKGISDYFENTFNKRKPYYDQAKFVIKDDVSAEDILNLISFNY